MRTVVLVIAALIGSTQAVQAQGFGVSRGDIFSMLEQLELSFSWDELPLAGGEPRLMASMTQPSMTVELAGPRNNLRLLSVAFTPSPNPNESLPILGVAGTFFRQAFPDWADWFSEALQSGDQSRSIRRGRAEVRVVNLAQSLGTVMLTISAQ